MTFAAASDVLLEWIIRGVGALWLVGAGMLFVSLRREAMLDGMISRVSQMTADIEDDIEDPSRRTVRFSAEEQARAWEDRDDRSRRRALAAQGVLLGLTGLTMVMMQGLSAWLCAGLVGAQGGYFLWRERKARGAPNADLAAATRPKASTVNAGWFSLAAGALVWTAAARGLLA